MEERFRSIVVPLLNQYIKKDNYNENNHKLLKKIIDNLDNICRAFLSYIDIKEEDTYEKQLNSLTTIATCLENILSIEYFKNNSLRSKIKELLDFRNIKNFDKKNVYEIYFNKCLLILIEYMIALDILSRDQSNEYLKICEVGFVPI